jgi:YHS domain-containing protein
VRRAGTNYYFCSTGCRDEFLARQGESQRLGVSDRVG